ncbi:hypothetical protein DV736_g3833, partial [Chaetothyriales sp. CBS 134916]
MKRLSRPLAELRLISQPQGRLTLSHRTLLTQAKARGPNGPPLLEETVGDNFARIVSQHGDRPAVISSHQRTRLSYHELDLNSNAVARGLLSLGVKKGDRVCVQLGNNIEFATATYALFKIGAVLVPLNPAFNATQITSALNHLTASYLIISTETKLPFKQPKSNLELLRTLVPELSSSKLESPTIPSLKSIILVDNSLGRVEPSSFKAVTPWASISLNTSTSPPDIPEPPVNHEIANIQFTSGTTSAPKAACLSHRSILNNGKQIGDRMVLTPQDIVVCPPPLFHCFGSILGLMATATHGSAIVFPAEAFDPLLSLQSVQEEHATALYGVPTMFLAELELIANGTVRKERFDKLRTGIAAGSSVPEELMKRLHKVLNLTELTICYGMTETSPVSCMTTTDDPIEKRIRTVGKLLPHVQAKVVDPFDRTRILKVGERGELVTGGYLVMKEYWGQPEKTAGVLVTDEDGTRWMYTEDEASMDEEGYVTITGRIKDLIIRGGENIHPLEIENCLFADPRVREVSVVGLPDDHYGEVVAAFIIKHDGEGEMSTAEVRDWVRDRLSHFLVPKYVFFVHEYPKTASGKIQKFLLRDAGVDLLKKGHGV